MKTLKEKPYLVYHSETEKNFFTPEKRIRRDNMEYIIGNYQQNNLYDGEQLDSIHEVEVKVDRFRNEEYIDFMGQIIYASKYKR